MGSMRVSGKPQCERALLLGQKRILEMIARDAPLLETLEALIRFVQAEEPGLRCGLWIVDEDGAHFRRSCGPDLPEAYRRALDGEPITPPYRGPCSEAAHAGMAVSVPDIAKERRWPAVWQELALASGFAACRSTPVRAADGRVLASFAFYYDHPRDPNPAHPELIDIATHLAGIALEGERRANALREGERRTSALLDALPAAIYTTDAAGRITYFNQAAVDLAGRRPEVGKDEWCVSWRLYWPDGTPMPHDQCPMAVALKENRPVRGEHAILERPDGTRIPFLPYPMPLRDALGALVGAVNLLVDISDRYAAESAHAHLAAIVESSDDAIVSKDLNGIVTSWNRGAEAVFGYRADEMIGRPILVLFPPDRLAEEDMILARLRRGERFDHFETVRRHKDGRLIDVSLTISPVRDGSGRIVGASKIARDITEKKQAEIALRESEARLSAELAAIQQLQGISTELINGQGVAGVYDKLVEAAVAIMRSDCATMQMLYPERGEKGELYLLASRGLDPQAVKFWEWVRADSGCTCGMVLRTGARAIAANVETCDFMAGTPDRAAYLQAGIHAAQSTPLISRSGRLLGMISTHWREPHEPSQADLRRFDVLARQAADLVERAQAERRLRDSEEQFRTLAESIPQLAWMANPDGWIFWYNRGWYDYTGTTPAQMEGWGWQSVHDPALLPSVLERWRSSLASGAPFEMVFLLKGADGVYRPFLTRIVPMRDAEGRITRWFGTNTDITEQRAAEEALRRLAETLEQRVAERTRQLTAETAEREKAEAALRQSQKMEAIGQLTGGIAHDFNNLLQVILGNLEVLRRRGAAARVPPAGGEFGRLIDAAVRGAERASTLTQRLLAFSRRQPLAPQPTDVNKLVAGMYDLLHRTLGEAIQIDTVLVGALPLVSVDANQLESAVLNLAVNARDAMPEGGTLTIETATVALAAHGEIQAGRYVAIAVTDTGTGMTPEVITRAFDPFFTTKDVGQGTGLGLSQVYGFIRQSGGDARIDSVRGAGTTVRLYLPALAAQTPAEDAVIVERIPTAARSELVLVVEDDPDVRAHSTEMLRELGYRVRQAADGPAALSLLQAEPEVRLLFTDLGLPGGLNGRQLAAEALRRFPGLKVLFTTGYAGGALLRGSELERGIELLAKPFTYAALAAKVSDALEGAPAAPPAARRSPAKFRSV